MFHPRKIAARFCLPILAMLGAALSRPLAATTCETLNSLSLTNTTITEATSVAAGAFGSDLPPFCRVVARSTPTADSNIKFEVWMPIAGWNGKFLGVGNNGFGGEISYPLMKEPLARGYATASTDTGHEGSSVDASFAFGHPEKLIDFGYRAVHEMAVDAKAIIAFYYARAPTFSYWNGCSTGGRQGLMEAQRFPGDFDGIIAGAPANNMTHFAADGVWISQAVHRNPASYVPPTLHPIIHQAVLDACDARDGVKDGVLEDPRACAFDPKMLECTKGVETSGCLTTRQVETLRKIYGAASNPRTKQVIFPGLAPGSELGWTQFWVGPDPLALAASLFKYVVFKDPGWDYRSLNFDSDIARADRIDNGTLNAVDPNLNAFFTRGGKLLQYHGWSDPGIAPLNSINYYTSVLNAMGGPGEVNGWYRLFMVPGMDHCSGGDGPDKFDVISVLEQWVENHKAPASIVASRVRDGKTDRTRPLCPYPQIARYMGAGSTDEAANFACTAPR